MNTQQAEATAALMYALIYPEVDDKDHATEVQTEMRDWLLDGDTTLDVIKLVREWKEYTEAK